MIAVLTGGAVVGGNVFLSGCTNAEKTGASFSKDDIAFLNEVADTILPATSSPGAKAANVGEFMTVIVNDCYEEKDQQIFHEGMTKLGEACKKMHGRGFMKTSPKQRTDLLIAIDNERKEYNKNKKDEDPNHYFQLMMQLTLWGYFTSEIGAKQALRYNPTPGRYEGCIDYKKGDRMWA